jgi:3-methylcrotonyl-CoA carboxylase beta subunit
MEALKRGMDELRSKAREGGGKAVVERWKARGKGKMTARER